MTCWSKAGWNCAAAAACMSGRYNPPARASSLQAAHRQNYEPEEVLQRLEHMVHPVPYERILIAEPEPAMREILQAELTESLNVPIEFHSSDVIPLSSLDQQSRTLVVALPTRAAKIRRQLPRGVPCIAL